MNCGRRVGDKGNKQWVWLALDVQTREIVGVHIGDRRSESALLVVAVTAPGVPPAVR
jgi:IS1 family transposase